MGNDARIRDLLSTISDTELASLRTSLRIVLDDPSYNAGDMKQMLLVQLFSTRNIPDGEGLSHKLVTETGLKATASSEQQTGVLRCATAVEAGNLVGNLALQPSRLTNALDGVTAPITPTPTYVYQSTSMGNPKFIYSRVGHQVLLNGSLQPSYGGVPGSIIIGFEGLPLASTHTIQSVSGYFVKNGVNYPLCGAMSAFGGYQLQIVLSSNVAFPTNPQIYVSCNYITE